jgi:hypothetical protein
LKRCCGRSISWKRGGIGGSRQSSTQCFNVFSRSLLCSLTENFVYRMLMEEYWTVTWEYWLINKAIVGIMQYLAQHINVNWMRATTPGIWLGLAFP